MPVLKIKDQLIRLRHLRHLRAKIFFVKRKLILLGLMVCTCFALWAQCPNADSIVHIVRSRQISAKEKLSTLLYLKSQAKICAFPDSAWAILLNGIASAYGENGEYLEGIHFINDAIQFITASEKSRTINRGYLSTCYYNLSRMYDAL